MKVPDKIYMPNELLSEEWQRHIEGQDTEYIRKDALLEWTKEKLEEYVKKQYDSNNDPVHWGQRNAFQQVIDKLNTL